MTSSIRPDLGERSRGRPERRCNGSLFVLQPRRAFRAGRGAHRILLPEEADCHEFDTFERDGAGSDKIKVLSVAKLLAEAIKRTYLGESVSGLFI